MKKPLITYASLLFGALAFCSVAAPARAQEATTPPPASSPPPSAPPPAGGPSFGGGAIGIGATVSFSPAAATDVLLVYDQPVFHIDAALGYTHSSNPANNTSSGDFRFGVGGWYHLARGSMADFSIGGTVGLDYASFAAGGSQTSFMIAPGAEARLFLSPNFALMGDVGLAIAFGDNNRTTDFGIGGETLAQFGFAYFFR